jgi:iron(III) transport system substrate-binding protein
MKQAKMALPVILAIITAVALSGCGEKGGTQATASQAGAGEARIALSDWAKNNKMDVYTETTDELYELAKKEGTVVLYSISSRCVRVAESFMKRYPGITVEAYDISTNELNEKITREYAAGVRNADLIHIKDQDGTIYQEKVIPGIFINYYPADICAHIDPQYMRFAMPLYIELNQWFYNKEYYPDGAPLDSWWDLTKPEWKGRVLLTNLIDNRSYVSVFTAFIQYADEFAADYEREFGERLTLSPNTPTAAHEMIRRLLANDIVFISSSDEICEAVGTPGQKNPPPVGYAASSKLRKNESDGWVLAPINISPSTGIDNLNNLYIVNEAPHPNAAKLLLRWMLGEADGKGDGFKPFNTLGGWPIRDDVEPAEGSVPLTDLKVWTADPGFIYNNADDLLDYWIALQSR